jgi:hypothetical protein
MTGKRPGTGWIRYWPRLLFAIPLTAILWVPSYNRIEPSLGGIPFLPACLDPARRADRARYLFDRDANHPDDGEVKDGA